MTRHMNILTLERYKANWTASNSKAGRGFTLWSHNYKFLYGIQIVIELCALHARTEEFGPECSHGSGESLLSFKHFNILTVSKKSSSGSAPPISDGTSQALITVSVHNRISWNPGYLSRSSQHAVLSCQTLGDLFN